MTSDISSADFGPEIPVLYQYGGIIQYLKLTFYLGYEYKWINSLMKKFNLHRKSIGENCECLLDKEIIWSASITSANL
jgi:hypothetical protein